jgi:hypothetical protein
MQSELERRWEEFWRCVPEITIKDGAKVLLHEEKLQMRDEFFRHMKEYKDGGR